MRATSVHEASSSAELRTRASSLHDTTIQPTSNIDDPLDAFGPLGSLCINTNNKIWLGACNLWAASGYEAGSRGMGSSHARIITGWCQTTHPYHPPSTARQAWWWYVLRVVAVLAFVSCGRSQNADPGPHRDALAAVTSFFFQDRSTRSTDF